MNILSAPYRRMASLMLLMCFAISALASKAVDNFVASPTTNPSSVSVYVYDLRNGVQLEGYNESVPLIPASITKALTIATTVRNVGIDYKYQTRVYTDGTINGGVLDGNVIIVGGGDPSLNSSHEPVSRDFVTETVKALKQKGIERIEGQILFDQSFFPLPAHPASWGSGDKSQGYGTGVYGFNFADNTTGKGANNNPALAFDTKLKKTFAANGITIANGEKPQGRRTLLFRHISPALDDIMRSCMRRSDNMFAETFLRTYAKVNKKEATPAAGAALEMDYWRRKGLDMKNVNVVDGSGLSRQNRLTAKFMGQMLQQMAGNVDYVSYFPLAGQEGTLRSFLKDTPLDSYIALKTGSMNGIQCYAGYKLDYNFAPTHVVVVMVNNMTAARSSLRKAVERMLLDIFSNE